MIEWFSNYWFLLVVLLMPLAVWVYRHERSYRKWLTAELEKFGFEYVSEESLDAFDTGPFPKPKFKLRRWWRRVTLLGIRDYWKTYRLVHFLNEDKEACKAWVRITYEYFVISDIKWNPILYSFSTKKRKERNKTDHRKNPGLRK